MQEQKFGAKGRKRRVKMVKATVPNFFICPISLRLMKNPVTISTGQTYDRRSIEKWFAEGHNTCPSTMQVLSNMDIAPNPTLQRLIHQWCAANNYNLAGTAEMVAPIVSYTNGAKMRLVMQMLREVARREANMHDNIKEFRTLASDLDQGIYNRLVLTEAGAVPVLANFVLSPESRRKDINACEEALGVLTLLPLHEIKKLVHIGARQLTTISWFLNRGSTDGRVSAALLLGILTHEDQKMKALVGNAAGIFEGLVQLLKNELCSKAVEAGLKAIISIVANGPEKNISKAVEAGVVFAVVDSLLGTERRSHVQTLTKLMEILCSTAEGKEAAIAHALVVPLLVRIINLRDSPVASERALSCLWTICQHSPNKCVGEAAGQAGILIRLSHVVESCDHEVNPKTKQRACQLLRQLRHSLRECSPRL